MCASNHEFAQSGDRLHAHADVKRTFGCAIAARSRFGASSPIAQPTTMIGRKRAASALQRRGASDAPRSGPSAAHQRSSGRPSKAPTSVVNSIAAEYQTAMKGSESSGQKSA